MLKPIGPVLAKVIENASPEVREVIDRRLPKLREMAAELERLKAQNAKR